MDGILPRAFELVYQENRPLRMRLKEVYTTRYDGLAVHGQWQPSTQNYNMFADGHEFWAAIPLDRDMTIISSLPASEVKIIAEELRELLRLVDVCGSAFIRATALHTEAMVPGVSLLMELTKDHQHLYLSPHYYPDTRLSQNWNRITITCSLKILNGVGAVPVTRVYNGYGQELDESVMTRGNITVGMDSQLGVLLKYQLGDKWYGFAVKPADWQAALWLVRLRLEMQPYMVDLPEAAENADARTIKTEFHKLVFSTQGTQVFIRTLSLDNSAFPLLVSIDGDALLEASKNPMFNPQWQRRGEVVIPATVRDIVGNELKKLTFTDIRFVRYKGQDTIGIAFPAVGNSVWRGKEGITIPVREMREVLQHVNGSAHRRRNELTAMLAI